MHRCAINYNAAEKMRKKLCLIAPSPQKCTHPSIIKLELFFLLQPSHHLKPLKCFLKKEYPFQSDVMEEEKKKLRRHLICVRACFSTSLIPTKYFSFSIHEICRLTLVTTNYMHQLFHGHFVTVKKGWPGSFFALVVSGWYVEGCGCLNLHVSRPVVANSRSTMHIIWFLDWFSLISIQRIGARQGVTCRTVICSILFV